MLKDVLKLLLSTSSTRKRPTAFKSAVGNIHQLLKQRMPRLPGFAYVCLFSHVTKKVPGDFGPGPPERDYYKSIIPQSFALTALPGY